MLNSRKLVLCTHPSPIQTVVPDIKYLEKYIVKDTKGFGHWFWHDGKRNHRHNMKGFALVTVHVKPTAKTNGVSRGEYVVARTLLEHRLGRSLKGVRVQSGCGLPQCINPDHWIVPSASGVVRWRLAAFTTLPWQLLDKATGVEIDTPVAAHVYGAGAVHVARIVPSHMRTPDVPLVALCGAQLDVATAIAVAAEVTCKGGC